MYDFPWRWLWLWSEFCAESRAHKLCSKVPLGPAANSVGTGDSFNFRGKQWPLLNTEQTISFRLFIL